MPNGRTSKVKRLRVILCVYRFIELLEEMNYEVERTPDELGASRRDGITSIDSRTIVELLESVRIVLLPNYIERSMRLHFLHKPKVNRISRTTLGWCSLTAYPSAIGAKCIELFINQLN